MMRVLSQSRLLLQFLVFGCVNHRFIDSCWIRQDVSEVRLMIRAGWLAGGLGSHPSPIFRTQLGIL